MKKKNKRDHYLSESGFRAFAATLMFMFSVVWLVIPAEEVTGALIKVLGTMVCASCGFLTIRK